MKLHRPIADGLCADQDVTDGRPARLRQSKRWPNSALPMPDCENQHLGLSGNIVDVIPSALEQHAPRPGNWRLAIETTDEWRAGNDSKRRREFVEK
jgi:hypothetical protein